MSRGWGLFASFSRLACCLIILPACGTSGGSELGESCTKTADCKNDLRCIDLKCVLSPGDAGQNICETACAKLKQCGIDSSAGTSCTGDCPAEYKPMMTCFANLSCDDLKVTEKFMACASQK